MFTAASRPWTQEKRWFAGALGNRMRPIKSGRNALTALTLGPCMLVMMHSHAAIRCFAPCPKWATGPAWRLAGWLPSGLLGSDPMI
jgi:hypothetical protein